jgi:type IV pilus assembly protein PilQ
MDIVSKKTCRSSAATGYPCATTLGYSVTGQPAARYRRPLGTVPVVTALLALFAPGSEQHLLRAQEAAGDPEEFPSTILEESAEDQAEQMIQIGADNRVNMHVSALPLADALRMLSEPTGRNIITADGVTGTVTASMYNVTFDDALEAILVSNRLGHRQEGDFIFIYPVEELAQLVKAQRKVSSRVFKLTYINALTAKILIEPLLSDIGTIAVTPPSSVGLGGEGAMADTEGDAPAMLDTLMVTDYQERLEEVARVLRQLDERPKQVLIEATILRATLNEDNALGIDFTTVGGIDFTTLSSTSPAAQSIITGNTPRNLLSETTLTARTDFNSGLPSGGFTFGIIKDQVSLFIRALEQITDTEILANPKLLALNKQAAQVIVGRRDGYFTTTVTETATIQTVEFLETGTILTFRPFIGDDGYVRMEIHPKDSTGGVTDQNLPFEQTTEVTTNVLVKDGHTIVIGGLFREVSTTTRGQVPLLGNLPIAGALFRRTRDNTIREEVIILLTVHILKGEPDSAASAALNEDVERSRVGMRRGIQWLGRESLGQAHYRWALEHLARGDTSKARWDLNLALHNYPRHLHASKLREKLAGQRDWESEASAIRSYVRDRIAEESGVIPPPYERPGPPFAIPEDIDGPTGFEEDDDPAAFSGERRIP